MCCLYFLGLLFQGLMTSFMVIVCRGSLGHGGGEMLPFSFRWLNTEVMCLFSIYSSHPCRLHYLLHKLQDIYFSGTYTFPWRTSWMGRNDLW